MNQQPTSGILKKPLLAFFCIAFLVLYGILSANNRVAADDYYFLKLAVNNGMWDGMIVSMHSWVTRWAAILFLNGILPVSSGFHSLLPYHLFTILIFLFALMNFSKAILQKFSSVKISSATLLLYSVLFFASFFFFSFSTGETFFWITSTAMYLWSVIFFIFGFSMMLQKEIKWRNIPVIIGCFLFIGGAAESVSINILILAVILLGYQFYKNKFSFKMFWNEEGNKMVLLAASALIFSLWISYSGEGRMLRQSALPHTGILNGLYINIKSLGKLLLFQLPLKIHWFIFLSVPWMVLGRHFSKNENEGLEKIFFQLVKFFAAFVMLSFLSFIPSSFLLGETGPFRTWILISLYLTILCSATGFYLGYKADWNDKLLLRFFSVSMMVLILLTTIHIIQQKEITSEYSTAVDKRINVLVQMKNRTDQSIIVLEPLPPPGMLFSSEISADSSASQNQHLKNYFNLEPGVRKK
ncbi:MAG: hypothetical protein NT126_07025 [Bacteroidetes bacterium]|nr:hypothetical protein [Bacteroidota bacterium]